MCFLHLTFNPQFYLVLMSEPLKNCHYNNNKTVCIDNNNIIPQVDINHLF